MFFIKTIKFWRKNLFFIFESNGSELIHVTKKTIILMGLLWSLLLIHLFCYEINQFYLSKCKSLQNFLLDNPSIFRICLRKEVSRWPFLPVLNSFFEGFYKCSESSRKLFPDEFDSFSCVLLMCVVFEWIF